MPRGAPHTLRGRPAPDGFVTAQLVVAVALSFVLVALLANLLVLAYGRGVVRAAVDEGARAAARVDAGKQECLARAQAVLGDLLGGPMGAGVGPVSCQISEDRVVVSVDTTFAGWVPGVPAWSFTTTAVVTRDPDVP